MIEITSFIWVLTLITSFVVCAISIKFTIPILKKLNTIDVPNNRSSHIKPTPKGAGIAIILALFLLQFIFSIKLNAIFIISVIILTLVSFINDYKQLSAIFRFLVQALIIYMFLYMWPPVQNINILNNLLPIWFEKMILFFTFLWFINLFNFMDGIDGITGVQSCIISIGTAISLTIQGQISNLDFFLCAFITGSSIAFLLWNWHPAKIFLGDAGSIPIGFINFVLLLMLCKNGLWHIALLLNFYYISDATYTLLRRIRMKKKPWEAHKEHFYQLPIQRNIKHSTVSLIVLLHGIFMIGLSITSLIFTNINFIIFILMIAGLSTIYLLYYFKYKL